MVERRHLGGVAPAGLTAAEVGLDLGISEFANGDLGANVVTVLHDLGLPMVVKKQSARR
jgi:hypothetical protein